MFEDFAAVQTGRTVVRQEDGTVEQVRFASVSTNSLTLLGGAVVIGRTFTDADGQPLTDKEAGPPGQPYLLRSSTVAVLSYDYWQRRYGGSAAVLGKAWQVPARARTSSGFLLPASSCSSRQSRTSNDRRTYGLPLVCRRTPANERCSRTGWWDDCETASASRPRGRRRTRWPPGCGRTSRSGRPPDSTSGWSHFTGISSRRSSRLRSRRSVCSSARARTSPISCRSSAA